MKQVATMNVTKLMRRKVQSTNFAGIIKSRVTNNSDETVANSLEELAWKSHQRFLCGYRSCNTRISCPDQFQWDL